MIARCWRGRTTVDNAPRYSTFFMTSVRPTLEAIPGFVGARVLRRQHAAGIEFLVITDWASWDAIRAFAGPSLDAAVVEPEARALLADYDDTVEHFELVG